MNVLTYVKKIQEIDILKYLLLDENQLSLLNFLSKPSVSLMNNNMEYENLLQDFNVNIDKGEIDNLSSSYNAIISKEQQTSFDKKLIRMFTYEIDNLVLG
jgi:hypothetical protein